jgi:hypothetical protein
VPCSKVVFERQIDKILGTHSRRTVRQEIMGWMESGIHAICLACGMWLGFLLNVHGAQKAPRNQSQRCAVEHRAPCLYWWF